MLMKKAHYHYSTDTQVPETIEAWREKREKDYPQFRFGSITLNLQLRMLFVCAIRSADFQQYKTSINGLLPWFFAMDHVNYARWLSVHLCDMLQLEDTNPDIFSRFNDGEFVISKTKRELSYIGIDHAHEQNNRCVKGDGGILINLSISQKKIISIVCYFNSAVFLGKQSVYGQHFIYNHNYFRNILILEVPTYVESLKN